MKNFTEDELKRLDPAVRYVEDHPEIIITKIEDNWSKIEVGGYSYNCELSQINTFIVGYKIALSIVVNNNIRSL